MLFPKITLKGIKYMYNVFSDRAQYYYSSYSGRSAFKSAFYCNTEVQNYRYNTNKTYYVNLTTICVEIPLHCRSGQEATVYVKIKS